MRVASLIALMAMTLNGCQMEDPSEKAEKFKKEIVAAESAFAQMAKEKGLQEAFLLFAADSAVVHRGDVIHKGKEAIRQLYGDPNGLQNVTLEWVPDFVDVSTSGDLGYTYGKYKFSGKDSFGKEVESTGIFHTVWKRQPDGNWKFVWD